METQANTHKHIVIKHHNHLPNHISGPHKS
jgi:hypothetical protein